MKLIGAVIYDEILYDGESFFSTRWITSADCEALYGDGRTLEDRLATWQGGPATEDCPLTIRSHRLFYEEF
jgi:hypothetical protein